MKLSEVSRGIPHIEDLPIEDIFDVVENIANYQVTEKVDGAQILFGIDNIGFYTSRETKGGKRIYNEADYGVTFSSTYMRSAHKLLETVLPILKGAGLRSGDQVEAEVLYGQIPNVVPYSADTNYLIFLRTTEGTVNIDRLKQKLDGQEVSVSLVSPFTNDGRDIVLREDANQWKFARVPVVEKSVSKSVLNKHLKGAERYLEQKDPITGQPFWGILETPLNSIPVWNTPGTWKDVKPHLKALKEKIQTTLQQDHILPLKEVLLDSFVRNTSSHFGPPADMGGWIEGVVLRHAGTGRMVKLVDKNIFGTVRESAWQKRNMIIERARSIAGADSFMGRLYLEMATSISHPELGTMQAKSYLKKVGSINEERISNLSSGIDFASVKSYWTSLLEIREEELEADLVKYEKEEDNISAGPGRFLAAEIKERTKQTFAETFRQINEMRQAALQSRNNADLINILVGKQLGEL